MNPANYREALIETRLDEAEGADILMVQFVSWLSYSNFLKALSRARVFSGIYDLGLFVYGNVSFPG